jgi:uncharacterized SAM-binding protein YcdF (DUF218 family)
MKLLTPTCRSLQSAERGSTVLVILVMLSIMAAFAIANSRTTYQLKRQLQLIEKRQLKRYEPTAGKVATPGSQEADALLAAADQSAAQQKRRYLFGVGQASLPAGSGGIPAASGTLRAGMPGEPAARMAALPVRSKR